MSEPLNELRDWRQNASYGASTFAEGGSHTELWFGPVRAMKNGSYISLHFRHPSDEYPRSLLLLVRDLTDLAAEEHGTTRMLHGETYRTVMRDGSYRE